MVYTQSPKLEACLTLDQIYDELPLLSSTRCIRVLDLSRSPRNSKPQPKPENGELSGALRVVNLDNCPEFSALSYVWGANSPGKAYIHCNGGRIPVTTACHQALHSLHETIGEVTIWVDAICINQKNDEEKNIQIPLMREIYTWARHVYIWLGPGNRKTAQTVGCLSQLANKREFPGPIPWHNGQDVITVSQQKSQYRWAMLWHFLLPGGSPKGIVWTKSLKDLGSGQLDDFLHHEWLSRAWTFQEIALASSPVILCGRNQLSWKKFYQAMESISVIAEDGQSEEALASKKIVKLDAFIQWQALLRVWISMTRPTTWNGREYRSLPAQVSNRSSCSAAEYVQWLEPSAVLRSARSASSYVYFALALIGAGIFAIGIAFRSKIGIGKALLPIVGAAFWVPMLRFWRFMFCKMDEREPFYLRPTTGHISDQAHILGLMRAIRERQATEPKDRAFAVDGVIRQLGCTPADPDNSKSIGQIYHEFTIALILWEPSFINILIDTGAKVQGAPSWVPHFQTIQQRTWLPSSFAYGFLDKKQWSRDELDVKTDDGNLSLNGAIVGIAASLVSSMPRIELDENGFLLPEMHDPLLQAVTFLHHWLAVIRRDIPIPQGYSSLLEAIFDVLNGRRCNPEIHHDDRTAFNTLYRILVDHSNVDDGIDTSKRPQGAIAEITRHQSVLNYVVKCCNRLSGKRGLFISLDGYVGSGPEHMGTGDVICVFKGVAAPMILRKDNAVPDTYRVLGPAFVSGLMDLSPEMLHQVNLTWQAIILI